MCYTLHFIQLVLLPLVPDSGGLSITFRVQDCFHLARSGGGAPFLLPTPFITCSNIYPQAFIRSDTPALLCLGSRLVLSPSEIPSPPKEKSNNKRGMGRFCGRVPTRQGVLFFLHHPHAQAKPHGPESRIPGSPQPSMFQYHHSSVSGPTTKCANTTTQEIAPADCNIHTATRREGAETQVQGKGCNS